MIPQDHDTYLTWDAAYVLGALSGEDRREYESHLAECARCRSAVGELGGMPGLLSLLDLGAVSYTHLTLPTKSDECRSRWSQYH